MLDLLLTNGVIITVDAEHTVYDRGYLGIEGNHIACLGPMGDTTPLPKAARVIDIAAWLLMIIPSFILAQGWVYFAAGNGVAKAWFGLDWVNSYVFSFPGLVTVMSLCKWPMAYITIKNAFEHVV